MYVAPCNVENSQTFVFLDHHLTAFTLAVTSVYLMISPKMANLEHRLRMLTVACKSSRFIANFCTSDSQPNSPEQISVHKNTDDFTHIH